MFYVLFVALFERDQPHCHVPDPGQKRARDRRCYQTKQANEVKERPHIRALVDLDQVNLAPVRSITPVNFALPQLKSNLRNNSNQVILILSPNVHMAQGRPRIPTMFIGVLWACGWRPTVVSTLASFSSLDPLSCFPTNSGLYPLPTYPVTGHWWGRLRLRLAVPRSRAPLIRAHAHIWKAWKVKCKASFDLDARLGTYMAVDWP